MIFIEEKINMPALFFAIDVQVYSLLTMHGTLGSPLTLIEGMATGRAIIASRLPEIAEIIRDGENGLLFTPGSSQELADCTNKLLQDHNLMRKLGDQAKRDSQKFRFEEIRYRLIKLYEELL